MLRAAFLFCECDKVSRMWVTETKDSYIVLWSGNLHKCHSVTAALRTHTKSNGRVCYANRFSSFAIFIQFSQHLLCSGCCFLCVTHIQWLLFLYTYTTYICVCVCVGLYDLCGYGSCSVITLGNIKRSSHHLLTCTSHFTPLTYRTGELIDALSP